MEEDSKQQIAGEAAEAEGEEGEGRDPESNSLNQPLLKRHRTLSSRPLALVGAKVSHIESLDYEFVPPTMILFTCLVVLCVLCWMMYMYWWLCRINENDLFKHDWRSRSKVQVLQYIFLKWSLAFLVGLLTGIIATTINLAVENIAGYKILAVVHLIENERWV